MKKVSIFATIKLLADIGIEISKCSLSVKGNERNEALIIDKYAMLDIYIFF